MGVYRPKTKSNVEAIQWVGSEYNCQQIRSFLMGSSRSAKIAKDNINILILSSPEAPENEVVLISSWLIKRAVRGGVAIEVLPDRDFNNQYEDIT